MDDNVMMSTVNFSTKILLQYDCTSHRLCHGEEISEDPTSYRYSSELTNRSVSLPLEDPPFSVSEISFSIQSIDIISIEQQLLGT